MKRLGILQMFDPDGIVDDYIIYLLDDLKKNVSRLAVVCNGKMLQDSVAELKKHVDDVFIRENDGFDAAAFKDALTNLIGWNAVRKYDELVLVNDSCFGPLFPLEEVFDEMSEKDCDYWAITRNGSMRKSYDDVDANLWPEHIHPYFWVIRSNMLKSEDFKRFWDELDNPETWEEAVARYEMRILPFFSALGYKDSTYVDCDAFLASPPKKNYAYAVFDTYRLVAKHECPFVKRKAFTVSAIEMMRYNSAETARKTLDYISKHTEYPERMIWKQLIRLCDVNDLRTALHLDYVFPASTRMRQQTIRKGRAAIIAHIYYPELIEQCFEYINRIPSEIDVFVTTHGDENLRKINECFAKSGRNNYRVIETENRGREISALLVACRGILMKYEYLGFVHDKKSNSAFPYMTVGQSYMDLLWENALKSGVYIENAIACFEDNPLLGFLSAPSPYMSSFLSAHISTWTVNFNKTLHLAQRLNLKCKMSLDKHTFALGTVFWCRTAALRALFEHRFQYEDFSPEPMATDCTISHAIEKIFPYVAQHEGYSSGVMMTDEYASLYTVNCQNMLDTIVSWQFTNFTIREINRVIFWNSDSLIRFCVRFKKIYLYGTGWNADRCMKALAGEIIQFMGYIVSDGWKEKNMSNDKTVYELSEITPREDEGIIVTVMLDEIFSELKKRGFTNVI